MGEIKSTLDLVLERTKHLTLSGEEKYAQRQKEIRQISKGLVQRFEDQILNEEQFRRKVDRLQKDYHLSGMHFLLDAILTRMDIDRPADRLMTLLQTFCHADTAGLQDVFRDYEQKLSEMTRQKASEAKRWLEKTHGIRGSAVAANLEKDASWPQQLRDLKQAYANRLDKQKEALSQRS
jgi:hypothetical protein